MKLFALFLCLFALNANASKSPYGKELNDRLNAIEDTTAKKAVAVYDVALHGGDSTSHSLGTIIPANAVITSVMVYINTAFTDSGTGSVALECDGTRDLMSYKDLTGLSQNNILFGGVTAAAPSGGVMLPDPSSARTGAIVNSAECEVTAVVRSDSGYVAQTAGKLTAFIEYFIK